MCLTFQESPTKKHRLEAFVSDSSIYWVFHINMYMYVYTYLYVCIPYKYAEKYTKHFKFNAMFSSL